MIATRLVMYVGLMTLLLAPVRAQNPATETPARTAAQAPADQRVPSDLRPLLRPPQSEMRLIVQRYTLDRATLSGNYDGGGRGGRGAGDAGRGAPTPGERGGAAAGGAGRGASDARGGRATREERGGTTPGEGSAASAANAAALVLSEARVARLKRYDLDWQAALGKLDASRLSSAARTDLDTLIKTIATNLAQLESDTATRAQVMPLMPFAPAIIALSEARIRLEPVDSKRAAGVLTEVTRQIREVRAGVEAGLTGTSEGVIVSRAVARRGADAVDGIRNALATWFNFYNGYDPVFTWWMGLPHKHADTALQEYSAFLREKIAPALRDTAAASPAAPPIAPAPAPALAEVPDLQAILALPQDEMTAIVERFIGPGGGRGGRGATNSPGAGRPKQYYVDWLAALKTLDFDRLGRNAQVDYLFIKSAAERNIARIDFKPQPNPPRKTDTTGITGAARGRDGLILDLGDEMIPYSPEQLIALAEREFAWCEEEMKRASRAMGLGDDWKAAIEKVKEMTVPPGEQPQMIRGLLFEAVDYVRAKDLVTVPPIASESLHMSMMSPEAQLVNPFFLGGALIQVSYPTNTMEYAARLQSMRGNNIPFSHATAFHEMIPGHNLIGYMAARYAGYRARIGGSTPFFGEGWPLYWELTLYDMGFHDTPEERVGALFWRMHRCARIIFSLKFHTGEWSPQECIDFLVARVGHERDNATAEVRRSFQGAYGPLYQAAYLLGGLQLRGLRRELVDSKQMTDREFHDEILRQGSMPIALLRLAMTKQELTREMPIDWKFYGDLPAR